MFGSINKTFGCCGKVFGCSNKFFFVVPNFVAVTKPFFPCGRCIKKTKTKLWVVASCVFKILNSVWIRLENVRESRLVCYSLVGTYVTVYIKAFILWNIRKIFFNRVLDQFSWRSSLETGFKWRKGRIHHPYAISQTDFKVASHVKNSRNSSKFAESLTLKATLNSGFQAISWLH